MTALALVPSPAKGGGNPEVQRIIKEGDYTLGGLEKTFGISKWHLKHHYGAKSRGRGRPGKKAKSFSEPKKSVTPLAEPAPSAAPPVAPPIAPQIRVAPPQTKPQADTTIIKPESIRAPFAPRLIGVVCGLAGLGFFAGNTVMNVKFGVTLAPDHTSRQVLGGIGVLIEVGASVLFAAAGYLWEQRRIWWLPPPLCVGALLGGLLCVGLSIGASMGYVSSNIGDGLKARDDAGIHRKNLEQLLGEAQAALEQAVKDKPLKDRALADLDRAIQDARYNVPSSRLQATNDCEPRLVTSSYVFCDPLIQLRGKRPEAERNVTKVAKQLDELPAAIRRLMDDIAALPSVSAKDPGAEQIAQMSFGAVTTEQARSYLMRIFAILSVVASGLLLAISRKITAPKFR